MVTVESAGLPGAVAAWLPVIERQGGEPPRLNVSGRAYDARMDGMITLDLGLPASPLRSFEVLGTLTRRDSDAAPPVACPPEVMSVYTAELSEWRMPVLAVSAGIALTVAEALVPEAAGRPGR